MALGADDVQAADLHDVDFLPVRILDLARLRIANVAAEFDVGAAAGHVRRDGDRARLTRARDDLRLALVVLGVENVVRQPAAAEHLRERFRRVDARRTNEHRIAQLVQPSRLFDDRVVLLAPRFVDEVLPVFTHDRPVRWNDRDFELIDLVELAFFRLRGSGHAGQLLVHAEVVLDGDRRHRLRLTFDVDAFLGFDRLVQTFRPPAPRHRTARELVDDQDFAFLHDVVHVLLVQRVRAQQLMDDVQLLGFRRVLDLELTARGKSLLAGQVVVMLDAMHFLRDVRQHERVVLVRRHEVDALVGEMDRMALLVEHEEQVLFDVAIGLLACRQTTIGDVLELLLLNRLLDTRLVEHLHQATILRATQLRLIQLENGLALLALLDVALRFADELIDELRLTIHEPRDGGVVLEVHPVIVVADGTRDDQRRPRFVDEDRVHFVDDRVVVRPLHALIERDDHVVAQVVEAELVIGPVRDVRVIGVPPLHRPGLGVVQAGDRQTEVVVEVPHPLRVAASEVRVHRHEMRALSRQRIQIERQRRDERLAFAGRLFSDLDEVQLNAAHELDVVVHHVPGQLASGDHDRRSDKASRALASRRARFGQNLVEYLGQRFAPLAFGAATTIRAAQLIVDPIALGGIGRVALGVLELRDALFEFAGALTNDPAHLFRLGSQLLFGDGLQPSIVLVDLVHDGLDFLPLPFVSRSEDGVEDSNEHTFHLSSISLLPSALRTYGRSSAASDTALPPR